MVQEDLTATKLKETLDYDPNTGTFTRKKPHGKNESKIVHGSNVNGYLVCRIGNKQYYLHRLAWMYVYEKWPIHDIDHINRNKKDNRICNLREVTRQQNIQNRLDAIGVFQTKNKRRWRARITNNRKSINIGTFATKEEAIAAYKEARKIYHPYFCYE